jgi:hypothetical protein
MSVEQQGHASMKRPLLFMSDTWIHRVPCVLHGSPTHKQESLHTCLLRDFSDMECFPAKLSPASYRIHLVAPQFLTAQLKLVLSVLAVLGEWTGIIKQVLKTARKHKQERGKVRKGHFWRVTAQIEKARGIQACFVHLHFAQLGSWEGGSSLLGLLRKPIAWRVIG